MINAFTRDARGNLIRSTLHGFYLFNARGDVVQRVNAQGVVIHTYCYTAFGVEQNPSASNTNPFRFAGEYYDIETGTIYLRARVFNPRTGRFTQPDPHWNVGDIDSNKGTKVVDWVNTHSYALNRMTERSVTQTMIDTWVQTGTALQQTDGKILYITQLGAVVLDSVGRVVTAYSKLDFDATMQEVVRRLFGG